MGKIMAKFGKHKKIDKEKLRRRSNLIIGFLIGGLMITSMFGVMLYGFDNSLDGNTIEYNDVKLQATQYGYKIKGDKREIFFQYVPQEVEGINSSDYGKNLLKSAPAIILTSDLNTTYVQDIALNSYKLLSFYTEINKQSVIAYTSEYMSIPVLTCENATIQTPVIYFKESSETYIEVQEYCLIYHFDSAYNINRLVEKTKYEILDII
jgi:hypothetical protein